MEQINNKYYIKLKAITPVSVGAGNESEWVRGVDYLIKDGNVYVLDLQRAAEEGIDLDRLSYLFAKGGSDVDILNLIGSKLNRVALRIFKCPCSSENNIKTFERSQLHDLPLVAGSSLKGALRSVLFNNFRSGEKQLEEVFGKLKEGTDFMRFIKVGDIEMLHTQLRNVKIFNLQGYGNNWDGGWKHAMNRTTDSYNPKGFNTLYECIVPGETGYGDVMFSPLAFRNLLDKVNYVDYCDKKKRLLDGGIKSLFAIVNAYTRNYLKKEREFFETYTAERSDEIVDSINDLLSLIPSDNSGCLLKMSAGVGFHAITGDWQFSDYIEEPGYVEKRGRDGSFERKKRYKSRKIVTNDDSLSLMGFVFISEAEEDEYKNHLSKLEEDCSKKLGDKIAKIHEAEEKKKEAIERENRYCELVKAAQEAESSYEYQQAIDYANEALQLFPDRKVAEELVSRNQTNLSEQRAERQRAEDEENNLQKVKNGLAVLLEEKYESGPNEGKYKVVEFKVCFQKVKSWINAAKVSVLPEDQKQYLLATVRRLLQTPSKKDAKNIIDRESSVWKTIKDLLSEAEANELYNEFVKK